MTNDAVTLNFQTIRGRLTQIRYTDDLPTTNWIDLGDPIPWDGKTATVTDSTVTNGVTRRFYQAVLLDR